MADIELPKNMRQENLELATPAASNEMLLMRAREMSELLYEIHGARTHAGPLVCGYAAVLLKTLCERVEDYSILLNKEQK